MKILYYVKKYIPFCYKFAIKFLNLIGFRRKFPGSIKYWERVYTEGGNSGVGSYNILAEYKASVINNFISENNIDSVVDFGCGDGNQLSLLKIKNYTGLDVSITSIMKCREIYKNDPTKRFYVYDPYKPKPETNIYRAELSMSLDVIYHLVEDEIYEIYMADLFASSFQYVIIYSSSFCSTVQYHVKHRDIKTWISNNILSWKLIQVIKNNYPYDPENPDNTSVSDFYIYAVSN